MIVLHDESGASKAWGSEMIDWTAKAKPAEAVGSKLPELQMLRGISVVGVLFCHLSILWTLIDKAPKKITMPLYLGVEIFFILSGFVITNSLLRDQFSGARFFIKRAFRLLPVILIFLAVCFCLNSYFQASSYPQNTKDLFSVPLDSFIQQACSILGGYFILIKTKGAHYNGAMWTLSVEDQFYAALALICLLTNALRSAKARLAGPIVLGSATLFYLAILTVRMCLLAGVEVESYAPATLMYFTFRRFDFLALGIMLAFVEPKIRQRLIRTFRDSGTFISPFLLLIPVGLAALAELPDAPPAAPVLHGLVFPVTGALFGLLVLLAANQMAFPKEGGRFRKAMLFCGDRSYTIYVFHYPAMAVAWLAIDRFFPMAFSSAVAYGCTQAVVTVLILLPFCDLVYRKIELPLSEYGRRLSRSLGASKAEGRPAMEIESQTATISIPTEPIARGKAA